MDWLQFIASIVASLAWPAVVIAAFFLLKANLGALSPFIERLKYKDFEVQFRKSIQELTERSRPLLEQDAAEPRALDTKDRLYELAEVSPRSAILEAWLQVESAALTALQARGALPASKASGIAPLRLGEALNRQEVISGNQLEIFNRLRELRNKAVHVGDTTFQPEEVSEYIALAIALASQIQRGAYR